MNIALFQSDTEPGLYAYTLDVAGENLPPDFAPWRQIKLLFVSRSGAPKQDDHNPIGMVLMQSLNDDGFSVMCSRSTAHRLGLGNVQTIH